MIQGGNLNEKEYTLALGKKLSKNANKPYDEKFHKLAKIKVKQGAFMKYKDSLKPKRKAKAKKVQE